MSHEAKNAFKRPDASAAKSHATNKEDVLELKTETLIVAM